MLVYFVVGFAVLIVFYLISVVFTGRVGLLLNMLFGIAEILWGISILLILLYKANSLNMRTIVILIIVMTVIISLGIYKSVVSFIDVIKNEVMICTISRESINIFIDGGKKYIFRFAVIKVKNDKGKILRFTIPEKTAWSLLGINKRNYTLKYYKRSRIVDTIV